MVLWYFCQTIEILYQYWNENVEELKVLKYILVYKYITSLRLTQMCICIAAY